MGCCILPPEDGLAAAAKKLAPSEMQLCFRKYSASTVRQTMKRALLMLFTLKIPNRFFGGGFSITHFSFASFGTYTMLQFRPDPPLSG